YIVYNAFDMEAISNMTYAGYSLSRTYFKVADSVEYIDLRLTPNFRAIGYATTNFDGNFDGNNTVFELELNNTLQYQGLFGVIGKNGVVKNLGVRGSIKGGRIIGGVAGRNYGLLENVYNMAKVTGTEYVGGITGYSDGDIIGAFNHGEVTGTLRYIGGIAGAIVRNKVIKN